MRPVCCRSGCTRSHTSFGVMSSGWARTSSGEPPRKKLGSGAKPGDAYALKMIVHDWDDARSIAILKNVRKAIRPEGRVLLMEAVIDPTSGAGAPGKLLDINMLVMTGGRERTAEEFAALYRASGFELTRIVSAGPISVIEGLPA